MGPSFGARSFESLNLKLESTKEEDEEEEEQSGEEKEEKEKETEEEKKKNLVDGIVEAVAGSLKLRGERARRPIPCSRHTDVNYGNE